MICDIGGNHHFYIIILILIENHIEMIMVGICTKQNSPPGRSESGAVWSGSLHRGLPAENVVDLLSLAAHCCRVFITIYYKSEKVLEFSYHLAYYWPFIGLFF